MDVPEDHTRPQKEGSFPEKPLERDVKGSKESLKVKKPSKFKSIFTKSKRNVPPDSLVAAIGPLDGEGDNKNENTPKEQVGGGPKFTPKSDPFKVKDSQLVFPSPANLVKEENVPVQIHHDPFLVRNAPVVSKEDIPRASTAPSLLQAAPEPTHVVTDERTPKRPQPQFKSKEGRKSVTMRSTIKGSKGEHSRNSHHQDVKKVAVRKNHTPASGTLRDKVEHNEHSDSRHFKRHNVKRKEKEKSRELFALVEELSYNCEYYKNALNRREDRQEAESYQLLKENESLNLQIFKLGQEIEEWKEQCQKMENRSTALSKAKSLTKENKDLLDDLEVAKSVIIRLNRELSYYQDKLRSKYKDAPEHLDTYSTSSSGTGMEEVDATPQPSKEWLNQPRKSLLPLLVAYDEAIADKEEIIKDHEMTLDRFKSKCMQVIKENDDLHKLISDNKDRGTISLDEWESLRVNAVLVLEENDLLHNQVDTLRRKEEKLFSTFQGKATGFKQTIANLEMELRKQVSAVADLETKCKRLTEENTNLNAELQTKISREKHNSMVQEFKQAFEELKSKYDSDKKTLNEKVTSVEKERERLVGEVTSLESENTRLRTDVQDCENNLASNNLSLQKMKTTMLEQTSAREATNNVIEDFMVHVQQLVAEKNKIVGDLNEQKQVNEQIMALRNKENELVSDLHGKIEAMERLHNEETKRMQTRLKEMEESLKIQSERHRREKAQFSELLGEKDKRIESIETEKRQLQQDLETVWRTTTTTMQNTIKGRPN